MSRLVEYTNFEKLLLSVLSPLGDLDCLVGLISQKIANQVSSKQLTKLSSKQTKSKQ
jgi:hypothetical protein